MIRDQTGRSRARRRAALAASSALSGLLVLLAACSESDPTAPPGETGIAPFRAAATCGACHPQHFEDWKRSMHAYGGVDPIMLAASALATAEAGADAGNDCIQCHSPALVRQNQWLASLPPNADPFIEDLVEDGINCDVCHSIDIIPPMGSIEFLADVDPRGPKLGGIRDPVDNSFHTSRHDNSFQSSSQCRSCHQIFLPNGIGVENTFVEWQDANASGMGLECQTCHMPTYQGTAAEGGPVRTVHRHTFVGVDYAMEDYRGVDRALQLEEIRTLLRERSVTVTPEVPASVTAGTDLTLRFPVTNDLTGHSVPSGTSFRREMWIQLEVRDAADALVYRSGWLEGPDDDLTKTDPDLVSFGSRLLDAGGAQTFFLWRAVDIDESKLLRRAETRPADYTFPVPVGTPGPLTVDVALRFRTFPPEVLRILDLERLLPELVIFDMWTPAGGSYSIAVE